MARSLEGWIVVVTRAEGPRGSLGAAFEDEGAEVLRIPTVEVGPPSDLADLERALGRIASYDWIAFTSPRSVGALASRSAKLPEGVRVAAVGPSTGARVEAEGWRTSVVGSGNGAETLAERLIAAGVGEGSAVLFPASSRAGAAFERVLHRAGARVDRVTAYETRPVTFDPSRRPELRRADVVTFTSPSAVEGWLSAIGGESARFLSPAVRYVVIGETTAEAAVTAGLEPIVAPETSFRGVVEAVRSLE